MERQGDEVHIETDEARGASSPNIVRWILGISLFAAIALLSVIWITGAATRDEGEQYVTVPDRAAEPGDADPALPTVENEAADAASPPEPAAT
jgi:predicted outer membrane lipoprotein